MRRRLRARVVLATVATAVSTLIALPGISADALDEAPPPRGPDTTVPYLVDRELHIGSAVLTVTDQSNGTTNPTYSMIGRDARGRWLVGVSLYSTTNGGWSRNVGTRVLAVDATGTHVLWSIGDMGSYAPAYFRLNRNRKSVLVVPRFHDGENQMRSPMRVIDLNGRVLAARRFFYIDVVLDFSGTRVVLTSDWGTRNRGVRLWRIGKGVRNLTTRNATFADLQRNVLAIDTYGRNAVVSITRPKRVRWHTAFTPMRLSPNGRMVLGSVPDVGAPRPQMAPYLQVRQVSNGRLLATFPRPLRGNYFKPSVAWNGNTGVVYQVLEPSDEQYLQGCTLATGQCLQVSDLRPEPTLVLQDDPFSFAFDQDERGTYPQQRFGPG